MRGGSWGQLRTSGALLCVSVWAQAAQTSRKVFFVLDEKEEPHARVTTDDVPGEPRFSGTCGYAEREVQRREREKLPRKLWVLEGRAWHRAAPSVSRLSVLRLLKRWPRAIPSLLVN